MNRKWFISPFQSFHIASKAEKAYLVNNTAGTDVQVSDLGVAHEAVGEADVEAVCAEGGVGVLLLELVHVWSFGVEDGVAAVVLFGGDTPAVDDDTDDVVFDLGSHSCICVA